MTDELELLDDTIGSILEQHCTREARAGSAAAVPAQLWRLLEDSGLTSLAMPEGGGGLPELVVLARAVGRAAAPVPLVETAGLAALVLTAAGLPLPGGVTASAVAHPQDDLRATRHADGWSVQGVLHRVPWGSLAHQTVALADSPAGRVAVVLTAVSRIDPGRNLAGEPRDTLHCEGVVVPAASVAEVGVSPDDLRRCGALLRSASIAGAMEQVLTMSLAHAEGREQFGRPLSSFQAVQHHLVAIAEEAVCTGMAVRAASVAEGAQADLGVAAAKATAGWGAQVLAARAHQVHGAIGTTQEHPLHWYTTRLWSWQDEFGSAQSWARRIGQDVLRAEPASLWPRISASVGTGVPGADDRLTPAGKP